MTITTRLLSIVGLFVLVYLPGCTANPFSGSAAMRIEVEVYKGPLSLEPEIQLGELTGYLEEAKNGLERTKGFIEAVGHENEYFGETACDDLVDHSILKFLSTFSRIDCHILRALQRDAIQLIEQISTPLNFLYPPGNSGPSETIPATTQTTPAITLEKEKEQSSKRPGLNYSIFQIQDRAKAHLDCKPGMTSGLVNMLIEAHRIAASMQASAFRYETASTAGQSPNYSVRIAMVYFIAATSEYGNQIQARTDALLKQLCPDGRDRRELPLSVHLREAAPTDFIRLFKWLNATIPNTFTEYIIGSGTVEDRIKILDRLYSDHFWSKINTVYASGRGKTQMSFVKDDTGNWNLKSFDNDPSDLLDAYTNVAKEALDGAVKVTTRLAKDGSSGGSSELAQQLLAIADQTALAKPAPAAPSPGTLSLGNLQSRLRQQLAEKILDSDKATDERLRGEVVTLREAHETAKLNNAPDENDLNRKLQSKTNQLAKHRQDALGRWTQLINEHSDLVDLLGSTVKKK